MYWGTVRLFHNSLPWCANFIAYSRPCSFLSGCKCYTEEFVLGHSLLVRDANLPPPAVLEQMILYRQGSKNRWLEKAPFLKEHGAALWIGRWNKEMRAVKKPARSWMKTVRKAAQNNQSDGWRERERGRKRKTRQSKERAKGGWFEASGRRKGCLSAKLYFRNHLNQRWRVSV